MYRIAARSATRVLRSARPLAQTSSPRRFLGTAPAARRGTWRGTATRWGLALGALYWYNTSPIFADEPAPQTVHPPAQFVDADLPTVEAVVEEKRRQAEAKVAPKDAAPAPTPASTDEQQEAAGAGGQSPEELEDEAGQQGAFDPETGEINWDCPCLGGMANGPCGEEFKAAFSCFVHSKEEPKGMDCIDKFQHMQDCFRKYPEIYGAELDEDEEGAEGPAGEGAAGEPPEGEAPKRDAEQTPLETKEAETKETETKEEHKAAPQTEAQAPSPAPASPPEPPETKQPKANTEATSTPKETFDATEANLEKK